MESFKLIGLKLSGKTKNENGQSGVDCGALWQEFEQKGITSLISNKVNDSIYAVYYDYESDENGSFSYFIGCRVENETEVPETLDELIIPKQKYHIEIAKGQMTGCITDAWKRIWSSSLQRKFGYDFEIYDERSHDWENAEIEIFISIKDQQ
jgi:predicted transcriptional regulator YdeE